MIKTRLRSGFHNTLKIKCLYPFKMSRTQPADLVNSCKISHNHRRVHTYEYGSFVQNPWVTLTRAKMPREGARLDISNHENGPRELRFEGVWCQGESYALHLARLSY